MPYFSIQTNVDIPQQEHADFLQKASTTVATVLGKPESYVMVSLEAGQQMMFAGNDAPLAYLQMRSLGLPAEATSKLSATLCGFIEDELGIAPGRVYIEFAGPERYMWGWDGGTF